MALHRLFTLALLIIGVIFIVAAVLYLTEPAGSLPSFMPGHTAGVTAHHSLRAIGAFVVGVVLLLAAAASGWPRRRVRFFS
jgi:hypothetical protein